MATILDAREQLRDKQLLGAPLGRLDELTHPLARRGGVDRPSQHPPAPTNDHSQPGPDKLAVGSLTVLGGAPRRLNWAGY